MDVDADFVKLLTDLTAIKETVRDRATVELEMLYRARIVQAVNTLQSSRSRGDVIDGAKLAFMELALKEWYNTHPCKGAGGGDLISSLQWVTNQITEQTTASRAGQVIVEIGKVPSADFNVRGDVPALAKSIGNFKGKNELDLERSTTAFTFAAEVTTTFYNAFPQIDIPKANLINDLLNILDESIDVKSLKLDLERLLVARRLTLSTTTFRALGDGVEACCAADTELAYLKDMLQCKAQYNPIARNPHDIAGPFETAVTSALDVVKGGVYECRTSATRVGDYLRGITEASTNWHS